MRNAKGQFVKGSSGFTGKHTDETKAKIRAARARQGSNVWNNGKKGMSWSGKPRPQEVREKIGEAQKGELNHQWKGENAGYQAYHGWVRRELGKAESCMECGKEKAEWANISGKYKRDLSDWVSLCHSCHMTMDRGREESSIAVKFGKWW